MIKLAREYLRQILIYLLKKLASRVFHAWRGVAQRKANERAFLKYAVSLYCFQCFCKCRSILISTVLYASAYQYMDVSWTLALLLRQQGGGVE